MSNPSGLGSIGSGMGMSLPSRDTFLKFLTQQSRLLTLTTALPDTALVAERFSGTEGVSEDYRFEIDCLSSSAHLEFKMLLGEQVSLRVLLADGRRYRTWHGVVLHAAQLGSDGGLARYRLVMEPWFACLRQRRRSQIFQDQTVQHICEQIFAEYPELRVEFRIHTELKPRALCTQFRERDADFIRRLLASEGLSYVFEHDQNRAHDANSVAPSSAPNSHSAPSTGSPPDTHSFHTLVIFDAAHTLPQSEEPGIRFHRASATESSDSLQQWQLKQRLTTQRVTRSAWDPAQLLAPAGSADIDAPALGGLGDLPELEDYDGGGGGRNSGPPYRHAEDAERSARFITDYLALQSQQYQGAGTVRQLAPATRFTLTGHPGYGPGQNRFTVLRVAHQGANNLHSDAVSVPGLRQPSHQPQQHSSGHAPTAQTDPVERGSYRNQSVYVRAELPLAPCPRPKPRCGLQSALVVGPHGTASPHGTEGTGTYSDRDGRIKIQFHWQRGRAPNPGGLPHDSERATGDETNGCWVRVAESCAGPNWGSRFTPRIGSEVLVDFQEADIDRPIVVSQFYNGPDNPPWPAGEHSNANHPGVVAGIHAPTLDGAGWNQWQLDDSTGQLRTRLATSAHATQLNLGYLIHHAPTGSQRGAWRGQGFELRTDAWQIQRAAQGMLITTTLRPNARSTQLDTTEAANQLKAAADTTQRLSDAASQSEADPLAQAARIDALRQTIHPEDLSQATLADGTGQPDRELKPFGAPAMLIESPSSIVFATPASTTLFASEQLSATVQGDTQLSAQHTASLVSGEATSLYTHAGGIQAITAQAALSIQAHDGELEILADQNVTVTSSNDEIHILAKEKIVLQAGQSSITLEGGNITFACPGKFEVKATQKALMGGGREAANLVSLPSDFFQVAPAGVDHPTLAPEVFSQALGFAEYPSQWLPFRSRSVQVFKEKTQVAAESVPNDELFTNSYLTEAPTDLRYAVMFQTSWEVEQSIDVAMPEEEDSAAEEEEEQ